MKCVDLLTTLGVQLSLLCLFVDLALGFKIYAYRSDGKLPDMKFYKRKSAISFCFSLSLSHPLSSISEIVSKILTNMLSKSKSAGRVKASVYHEDQAAAPVSRIHGGLPNRSAQACFTTRE